jgi:hypothetical protein
MTGGDTGYQDRAFGRMLCILMISLADHSRECWVA